MKNLFFIAIMSLFTLQISAQDLDLFFNSSDTFFKTYVKNGLVDYKNINKMDLNVILDNASKISVTKSDANNFQAFWINAYNLAVIKGLLDNMPIKSPLDKAGFFDKTTYNLAGKQFTLNDIEHKLLRANFKDARFHFVLVCGAIGCPPLISKAYFPNTLDTQLTSQTKEAINGAFLQVNKNKIKASEIMKWYKEDFTMNGKTEIDFINTYRKEKVSKKAKISYFPYNWTINKQ
jgi:hypothetical protein